MSSEVDFLIDQVASVAGNQPADHPLVRIDRDDVLKYSGSSTVANSTPERTRQAELEQENAVSFSFTGQSETPVGTEYDHALERTVNVRIEGVHESQWGHIDPDGSNGVEFTGDGGLVDDIRDAILQKRTFPSAGPAGISYKDLMIENSTPQSGDFADHYRYDFDVVFKGFETLP